MNPKLIGSMAVVATAGVLALAPPAWSGTKCTLRYSLEGWSALYSTASGSGTARCDNGESARVSLRAKGGGLTAGKSKIVDGSGTFSEIADISELFGKYAAVEVHAGAVGSSAAQVVTKGTVSLAFAGTGKGVDLGLTFGEFDIQKQTAPRKRVRISSQQ
jgi:hypothetical protein